MREHEQEHRGVHIAAATVPGKEERCGDKMLHQLSYNKSNLHVLVCVEQLIGPSSVQYVNSGT